MATGRPAKVQTEGVCDDGGRIPAYLQTFPVFERDGSISGFVEIAENITKRLQTEKALQNSEKIYRTLVENIGLGINLIDTNYRIVMTNAAHARLQKKTRSKFLGNFCFKEFEKRNAVCPHCPGKKAMATGHPATAETEGIGDDGTHSPVWIHAFPVLEADGTIKGFVEIVEDLTKRKQTEEKLKESEERFKAIFENAPLGILLIEDKNKKFYLGNKTICKMLGYKPEEIKNLAVSDIHPKEHLPFVLEQFERLAKKETSAVKNIPVKRKDGRIFYADISAFPMIFGGRMYLTGIFRDITERKKAEEELHRAEAKYRILVEHIPAVTYTAAIDKTSTTIYVSPQIQQFLGFSQQRYKIDHDLWLKQLHPDDRQRVLKSLYQTQKGGPPLNCEYRMFDKDGRVVWLRDEAVMVRDNSGKPLILQGVMFDITAQKEADEELNKLREKMAQAERLASLGTISATVAHELTQPLTVIRLSIENSLEDLKAASYYKTTMDALKDALNEVANATSVVDRFRNYARRSSVKNPCKTNLGKIAVRVIQLLNKTAQNKKIILRLKGLDKLPAVYANEKDLEQLFFALTENAIHAADGKKNLRLIIEGVVKDKNIKLRFADNCCGIAPENLDRIFDPFFTTKPEGEGTGFGLPIVQQIVSQYEGKLSVKSNLGKGTTFYITFPIHSSFTNKGVPK
jgi:PAS domain S-box-containing protein